MYFIEQKVALECKIIYIYIFIYLNKNFMLFTLLLQNSVGKI